MSPRKIRSEILNTYKQASELFLTRRLSEALSTIEPLVTSHQPSEETIQGEVTSTRAPIASADRKSRIKVWTFYTTLLNAIAELGPEEGKAAFGNKGWTSLVTKVQDGTIWDEVVSRGYKGLEGSVDADVVASLATLLLAQSVDQTSNQQHLEAYLSASNNTDLDVIEHSRSLGISNGQVNEGSYRGNGTDTPRDVNAFINIVELYTLHVLPRNGEWEYAKEFIKMSEVLDEEMREAFSQDLQSIENESKDEASFEDATSQQEDLTEQDSRPIDGEERTSVDTIRHDPPPKNNHPKGEIDYGIDSTQSPPDVLIATSDTAPPPSKNVKAARPKHLRPSSTRSPRNSANADIYKRGMAIIFTLQKMISNMADQISQNPMRLLRFVFFLMGLIVAFSRRDVKERLGGFTGIGWEKVRRTIGMGTKISYI